MSHSDPDTCIWTITGSPTCEIARCSQPAAIITDTTAHRRFCVDHSAEAASVALLTSGFGGWYRVTASRTSGPGLIVSVHPL
jgi:hypothetical protein